MPDLSSLWWFFTASLVLLLIPGPSVLYVTGRTLDQGRRAGLLSTLGLACGDLVQVVAAVVGLSALVASSETAFDVVKYAGAGYLVWLGVKRLRTPDPDPSEERPAEAPARSPRIFSDGLVVNALNPKSTLFFLAFLPSFIHSGHGAVWSQTLVFGLVFVLVGVCTNAGWALLSSLLRQRARQSRGFLRAERYIVAGVFLVLAAATLATGLTGG
ncbi:MULTISPECIES: LysE family translocator [unclassified Kitasatospora]|uniref:LysE family translocator n=1 Tax=unclassified Kitasatospora TaxID=2633591 RepID=UPI000DBA1B2B|nr:LysE family translocator [Kitasatospora sp. SolWspMP-SS2h]RAJ38454.1 threonine/homoserine/homoserine lactone efflux protein [Kitasatospora sp. SolWspMP-SS2h]